MKEFNTMIPIPDRLGYYATDTGLIFSEKYGDLKQRKSYGAKYLLLNISVNGKVRSEPVHRLILETFIGKRPEGMQARHLNGNAHDNRIANLVWGTRAENDADKAKHGKCWRPRGEKGPGAKLTTATVLAIRAESGLSYAKVAKKYNISRGHAGAILRRVRWGHI